MNNYWFLYNTTDGSIYGLPYMGSTTEWTNIPQGCGVVGFIGDEVTDTVKDAFTTPQKYTIANNELTVNSSYVVPIAGTPIPSDEDRITALESALSALMGV
ncbi:hypothetical protein [Clostridium sp.]|uniref:hypothetical protein n=1 Tax=Clostridium sp. TaxID=1506 RepID=UPI00284CA81A|nr:hypothetical protein [Clostridium sp.]MDR3595084.1 hypothetical protein [Clostridium sp.]